MQFPVPQFTDVEDKIFGPLTIKQFGILFGAGVIIFLGFSASKSILVLVFLFLLFGLPALGVAFAKINGRPIYNTMGYFVKFLSSPRVLVFHKEANNTHLAGNFKDAQIAAPIVPQLSRQDTQAHLKAVQELLSQTANKEQDITKELGLNQAEEKTPHDI